MMRPKEWTEEQHRAQQWADARHLVNQLVVRLIPLVYHSAGDPFFSESVRLLRVLKTLDMGSNLSVRPPGSKLKQEVLEASQGALDGLEMTAHRYLAKLNADVQITRAQAARYLKGAFQDELTKAAGEDLSELKVAQEWAAALTLKLVSELAEWGPVTGAIGKDLPKGFQSQARVIKARKAFRSALLNLDREDLEKSAVSSLKAALIELGYPKDKARTLFRLA